MAGEAQYAAVPHTVYGGGLWNRNIRTVVVDDMDEVLDAMCAILAANDHIQIVARARNGAEAVEAVAQFRPDLLLMDVNMPAMSGVQAASILTPNFPETKIVLMSAGDSAKLRDQCRSSGADGFIDKVQFSAAFPLALKSLFSSSCPTVTA
jgi:DNA-binding NarL/FixJ family response regulator